MNRSPALPTLEELNSIQAEWMKVDPCGDKAECARVCKLMERYPKRYISGHDGVGVTMIDGGPCSATALPLHGPTGEIERCRKLGGRVDVIWNGKIGQWEKMP